MITVIMVTGEKCAACKKNVPVFERVASEYADDPEVMFREEDVMEAGPELQAKGVMLDILPTFVILEDGHVVNVLKGVQTAGELFAVIENVIEGE